MAKHKDLRIKGVTVEGGLISHLEHSGWDVTCKPHSRSPLVLASLPVALSPGDKEAFRIALAILTWKMDQA